jgi:periplasmic divalent cation tolerance protein
MAQVRLVYATFPNAEVAAEVGRALVAARLVACVNVLPTMTAIYQWEGALETATEAVALFKTTEELAPQVVAEVTARHPYKVPAVVIVPIDGGNADFLSWVSGEVKTG